jgi:uncharacterized protein involved in exopolysaccharide biosynthesis
MSPDLSAEHGRLMREVSMRQSMFMSLAQAYAQARMESIRNTPVITIVERPSVPAKPNPRGTVMWAVLGTLLGGVLSGLVVLGRHLWFTRTFAR